VAFEQAIRQHQGGHWDEADAACQAILARDPHHIGSLHLRGVIAQQRGLAEQAAAWFRRVIALRPDIAVAHQGLGSALAAAGNLGGAATAFEQALKLGGASADPRDSAQAHLNLGNLYNQLGRFEEASRAYARVLAFQPDHAEAHNNLGAMLLAQGRAVEAAAHFARSLVLAPELFEAYSSVSATLQKVNAALNAAVGHAVAAWPERPELEPEQFAAIASDPMLAVVLESATVRDIDLEKFLTGVRSGMLERATRAGEEADPATLRLACAVARQCFINEYVWLETPAELERCAELTHQLADGLSEGRSIPVLWLAAVASYRPLGEIERIRDALSHDDWPAPVVALLAQQIREPDEEQRLRRTIPQRTAIAPGASEQVRRQYEENPYSRWVFAPSRQTPIGLDDYLRLRFPHAPFQPLGDLAGVDILIAGCGTGEHPIGMARRFRGARVLAIDLSLASLAYAMRKTHELGVTNIEYAQADILELANLGRAFDVIDASGVLHHLSEPFDGWQQLLALLRPQGLMRIGLYSELGRADIAAARNLIAERGWQPSDLRRSRYELLATSPGSVAKYRDFYSLSECRDLLFHVQEQRMTLPQIAAFVSRQNLRFLGFELAETVLAAYRESAPSDAAMTDLERWHAFETQRPETFSAMYQFWCQRG
jgi:2-polyprenyl-3-methyl-5-hydroxy-6-metoxy-1,4-benzoquinol methylase/Tfp pilus assembly protein PilF